MSITELWAYVEQRIPHLDSLYIRSMSATHLYVCPGPNERLYDIHRLLITIERQGCSYTQHSIDLSLYASYFEMPLSKLKGEPIFVQIAVLDALMPSLSAELQPLEFVQCQDKFWKKALWRADLIAKNTRRLLTASGKPAHRVALVGYVNPIVRALYQASIELDVFDLDEQVIGKVLENDIVIQNGHDFFTTSEPYDAVVVTGMTLANNTFWKLQKHCQHSGALLVMYAQTGGHLGPVMVELGVDLFLGECFPFYYEDGLSEMIVYLNKKHEFPSSQIEPSEHCKDSSF